MNQAKYLRKTLAAGCMMLAALAGIVHAAPPDAGWAQIWGDEFDGTAANTNQYGLDLDKWSSKLPFLNSGGNDRWFSSNDAHWIADEDTYVTNGNLVIRAETSPPTDWAGHSTFYYKTGWANTRNKFEFTFGYAEARSQSPDGTAMWPAWWLLGNGWPPEVDIFERYPNATVQQGIYYAGPGGTGTWDSQFFAADPIYDMRTWGFEWSPSFMGLSKDGVIRNDFSSPYVYAQPLYMVLSGGVVTNGANGGSLAAQTFPADYIIDYVRFYKRAEHIYNGNFSAGMGAWDKLNANTTIAVGGGVSGDALALTNGADAITPSTASQMVYGLIPNTRYWFGANLKSGGNPVYLGVKNYGGEPIEQATNTGSYAPVNFVFTNGPLSTTATLYTRLNAGAGLSGNADNIKLRRAAAVSDPGFEVNDATIYWDDSYGSVSINSANARSGNRCLAITASASAVQQTIYGLLPNTTYQLSTWIRNNGNTQTCSLGVKDFGGTQVLATTSGTANPNYLPYSVTFTTGATNTTALIFVWLPTYNAVPIYVDDFLLIEPLVAPWQQVAVGTVSLTGAGGQRGAGGFQLRGAGSDIWGTADSFQMLSRPVTNDCRLIARLLKVDPTDASAKVGITLREGTTAGARHITLDWMPQQVIEALWRTTTNGSTATQAAAGKVTVAPWVKLERIGNVFSGAWSLDGIHWSNVTTQTLALPSVLQAGLVVCAHNAAQLNEGVFESVFAGNFSTRVAEDLNWNGGGSWNTTSANWLNSTASSVVWSNALADGATFSATGVGVVSLATNITVRSLTFNTAGYTLTNQTLTLAGPAIVANADATIASAIAGAVGLNKSGAGMLTLTSTNTWSGGTVVSAGTLKVSGNATLGLTNNPLTVAGGVLDLGGTSRWAGTATVGGGSISNGTLLATTFDGRSGTVNAVLAGSSVSLTKTTSGLLTLGGTNTYTGGTILDAGTLSIASAANLGGAANLLTFAGGLLQITGTILTNLNSQSINWSTFDGGFDIASAASIFTITNVIGGSGGLTKAGAGTLRLTNANTYLGATIINGGTLLITNGGGIYKSTGGDKVLINTGGVLSLSGDIGYGSTALGWLPMQADMLLIDGGTFRHTGASNAKNAQPGAGRLFSIGEQGATLDSATAGQEFRLGYRYDFGANISNPLGGTLTLTGAGNGDLNFGLVGAGAVVKSGAGTWNLTGTNSYTGDTTVNAGTLTVNQASFATNSTLRVAVGALLNLNFSSTNTIAALVLGGTNQPAGIYKAATHPAFLSGGGSLRVVPATAPATPTNLMATAVSGNQINLSWSASSGAASYQVKRATVSGGPYTIIDAGVIATNYLDTGLSGNVTYYYVVSAVNNIGESGNSVEVSATAFVSIGVTNFSFELPGTGKLQNWGSVPGWSSDTVAADSGVEILGATTDGVWRGFLMSSDPSVWQLTGHFLGAGETIKLTVDALVTSGGTNLTMAIYYDNAGTRVTVASQVVNVTASWQTFELTLNAAAVPPPAVGKRIGILLDNTTPGASASWLGVDMVRFDYVNPAPAAPTGLAAIAGNATVALDWADNTESDLANYNVYRSLTPGGPYSLMATNIATSNYSDNSVTNGTTYYYAVAAVDVGGMESAKSSETSATPHAPYYQLVAVALTNANQDIVLTWSAQAGWAYRVWTSTNLLTSWQPEATNAGIAGLMNFIHTNLMNEPTRYFRVEGQPGGF
jgi:autotransporter-associated beta strand protein